MGEESAIQGLNIIQDDLSPTAESGMHPELEAQLQMWTNLEFPTDDGPFFNPERDTASRSRHKALNPDASNDPLGNSLSFFGNVGAALSSAQEKGKSSTQAHSINDLLSWGFYNNADGLFNSSDIAVDPFLSNNVGPMAQTSNVVNYGVELAVNEHRPLTIRDGRESKTKSLMIHTIDPATTSLAPAAKRQKLRKPPSSVDLQANIDFADFENTGRHSRAESVSLPSANDLGDEQSHEMGSGEPGPYSAAEDKRRRNTLASARFRLKKKEREVAMEKKAKELDDKVSELERECESLRKENQWLKGLVVGATNGEGSNHGSALTSPANGMVNANPTPANGLHGTSITNVEAAKGNVIDIDELIRVLRANGATVTGSGTQGTVAPIPPTTGKRKRGSAN